MSVALLGPRSAVAWLTSETTGIPGPESVESRNGFAGSLGLEGLGYVNSAANSQTGSANAYTALIGNLSVGTSGSVLEAYARPEAQFLLDSSHEFYGEAPEAYVGTSRALSTNYSFALGRKLVDWNRLDETWQLGIWQPRYRWDYLNPEQVGMTGAYFEGQPTKWLSFQFFATPIFVPERGVPVEVTGGQVSGDGDSHWFIPPPASATVLGQATNVSYNLAMPSLSSIVMNPGTSLRMRVGESDGPWASGAWALKPMNQLFLATEGYLDASQTDQPVIATIHPRVVYAQDWSGEVGYRTNRLETWISLLDEQPIMDSVPDSWIAQEASPALSISPGVSYKLEDLPERMAPARISASYLWERGGNAPDSGNTVLSSASSSIYELRYPFQDAVMVEGNSAVPGPWGRALSAHARTLYDLDHEGLILSGDLHYLARERWNIGVGADFLATGDDSADPNDFVSRYRANDRVYAEVSYVF